MMKLFNNVYLFWFLLTIPMIYLVADKILVGIPKGRFFYWTGALSAIFVIVSLAITPATRLFPRASWRNWLIQRRRYIGVAGFAYAAVHTLYWIEEAGLRRVVEKSLTDISIIIAWISIAIFGALALTSNDYSVRKLGPTWKDLQRWVYLAMPLGLLHWFMSEAFKLKTIVIYGGLFAGVMATRIAVTRWRARPA